MQEQAVDMLKKSGFRDIEAYDQPGALGLGIHEMGTARMGRDPKTSVLNGHNQVHACKNVYVTDGAFMTSSSCVNPSLTYMAFTARAANHAAKELKKEIFNMKRRAALKNMGMVFGYAAATPALLSVLQSCQEKAAYADWVPTFFDKDKGLALAKLIDVILPKTDTPSATELNLHGFIDSFSATVLPEPQQKHSLMLMNTFMDKVLAMAQKEDLNDLEDADFEAALGTYLRKYSEEEQKAHDEIMQTYWMAVEAGEEATLPEENACHTYAHDLRGMLLWCFKKNEIIAEQHMAYLSIPGEYIPCGDVDELTQGKAWAL